MWVLRRGCVVGSGGSGRVACEQCTFLLPSSSSSSLALLPTSLRMGLCRGDGVWPGRLRVDIWKEGDRQSGPLGLRGESWGLSTTESARRDEKEGTRVVLENHQRAGTKEKRAAV